MTDIYHALVLNLHQPPGNLEHLLAHRTWEAKEILYAYDRIARSLWDHADIGRVHVSLSGTLLETLSSPEFQNQVYGIVDCGALLWHLQNGRIIEVLGTGYYHPVFPLIPFADQDEQLVRWQEIGRHLFWRQHFEGFWPPEMGFTMEMIPLLKRLGYRYVIVDSEHVEPVDALRWEEIRYRPHIARHAGEEIIIVVRDRELSDAQESGMDYPWFRNELEQRTKWCDFPPLVTTCTDGENGGWFRNTTFASNFWGAFYTPLLEDARRQNGICPTFISKYLNQYGAHGEVSVRTGAWNTGWHHGRDFLQWTGSQTQKDALARIEEVSRQLHAARRASANGAPNGARSTALEDALRHLLRAETSCNFYWGEDWVSRCHQDLDAAVSCLEQTQALNAGN